MIRSFLLLVFVTIVFADFCPACSCVGTERPCEDLRSDVVFVGRVIEKVAVQNAENKNAWPVGYSMRFAVEESIVGKLGTEVTVLTGNGAGDCGSPLPVGGRFLIFTYKKGGILWTNICQSNEQLRDELSDDKLLEQYRSLIRKGKGSIFGKVVYTKPIWREDEVEDTPIKPLANLIVHANSKEHNASTKTRNDGSYEFDDLPIGSYTIVPNKANVLDFDHAYESHYQTDLHAGLCKRFNFLYQPTTRIRGHVIFPSGMKSHPLEVVAIPTHLKKIDRFSGQKDSTNENDRFDLWPLPPGDYYVGVNINSSPNIDSPFPPTYFPGVINKQAASIVHLKEGETKEIELPLLEMAKERIVYISAIGLDGKPMREIDVQLEDFHNPGTAAIDVHVDLDSSGKGTMNIYQGYSYHLHGRHFVNFENYWCSKTIVVSAGTDPIAEQFIMDRQSNHCRMNEIDGLK